MTDNMGLHGMM